MKSQGFTLLAFVALASYVLGDEVQGIKFTNVGISGTYNKITSMSSNGQCTSAPFAYGGSLAPYDEEMMLVFRGPLKLNKFAVYNPEIMTSKRHEVSKHLRHHRHHHPHHRNPIPSPEHLSEREAAFVEKREHWVVATIDGKVVSWINNWSGGAAAPTPAPAATPAIVTSPSTPCGSYSRIAFYNSVTQEASGLVFLANHGGAGSGVFDYEYGMSLSYVDASGTTGSASRNILADTTIPSNTEFIIASDKDCTDNSCGYTRPGGVAYHGFSGGQKIILMQLSMPSDGISGFNADMPAVWALNYQLLNTIQYGRSECSCWTSGCGEFDILEVLTSGSDKCTTSVHGTQAATPPQYIKRPTDRLTNYAAIFNQVAGTLQIQTLPDDTDFGAALTQAQVDAWAGLACSTYQL